MNANQYTLSFYFNKQRTTATTTTPEKGRWRNSDSLLCIWTGRFLYLQPVGQLHVLWTHQASNNHADNYLKYISSTPLPFHSLDFLPFLLLLIPHLSFLSFPSLCLYVSLCFCVYISLSILVSLSISLYLSKFT